MFLAENLQLMNHQPPKVAATMVLIPAWMRFLETQGLLDAILRKETLESLKPLAGDLLKPFDALQTGDPVLHEAMKRWSEDSDKELL